MSLILLLLLLLWWLLHWSQIFCCVLLGPLSSHTFPNYVIQKTWTVKSRIRNRHGGQRFPSTRGRGLAAGVGLPGSACSGAGGHGHAGAQSRAAGPCSAEFVAGSPQRCGGHVHSRPRSPRGVCTRRCRGHPQTRVSGRGNHPAPSTQHCWSSWCARSPRSRSDMKHRQMNWLTKG